MISFGKRNMAGRCRNGKTRTGPTYSNMGFSTWIFKPTKGNTG
jgi:hypothetical protein